MYWEIGNYIIIHVQKNKKAGYGEEVIEKLSKDLKCENIRFSGVGTLKNIRKFYIITQKKIYFVAI